MLLPRLIDLHVHLREPGQTHKGDAASETAAAWYGGFGLVTAMANTVPAIDTPAQWEKMQQRLRECARVPVVQCAAMTVGRLGREPVDAAALKAAGVIALSDDGTTPQDPGVMREVAWRAAEANLLLIDHCEDSGCTRRSEIALAERDMELSRLTGARFHLQHLSTLESVELLEAAQTDRLAVSGEVTPHHLAFTREAVNRWGANARMAPPLRGEEDRQALLRAVAGGVIAAVATDHAPHTAAEKALPPEEAPNGIIGLEAAFPVAYTLLVHSGMMSLPALLRRFIDGPAKILGVKAPEGNFEVELEHDTALDCGRWHSRSMNSPWHGYPVAAEIRL